MLRAFIYMPCYLLHSNKYAYIAVMTERHSVRKLDCFVQSPSRRERIEKYLANNQQLSVAASIAESFSRPDKPLANTVVLIPVAVEQDTHLITHAMREYAQQKDSNSFSVCLLLNGNLLTADETFTTAVECIRSSQSDHANSLDIRYATIKYDTPAIGQIRKNLWDGVLALAHAEGAYDTPGSDVIGINHDIDTISISPHYIRNVQQHYEKENTDIVRAHGPDAIPNLAHTLVSHHFPFDTHPNTAKGMYWFDITYRRTKQQHGYEEGITMPLSYYARQGGFNPRARTHESGPFIRPETISPSIEGTGMKTSPRRYIDRFPAQGYDIWSSDTFSDNDPCRDTAEKRDATPEELATHIRKHLSESLRYLTLFEARTVFSGAFGEEYSQITNDGQLYLMSQVAASKLERRYRQNFALAERTLRSIGLPDIAHELTGRSHIDSRVELEVTSASLSIQRKNISQWEHSSILWSGML